MIARMVPTPMYIQPPFGAGCSRRAQGVTAVSRSRPRARSSGQGLGQRRSTMGFLDKLLGRNREPTPLHEGEATPDEHERHLEQSANPGTAPVVAPDESLHSPDELDKAREEGRGDERAEETRLSGGTEEDPARDEPPRRSY